MNFLLQKEVGEGHFDNRDHADSSGQPSIISQWHIDNTLAAISKTAAGRASASQDMHAGMVFMSFCKILNTLLNVHRTKLGGRYHLIIPALQSLLHCLFSSYTRNNVFLETADQADCGLGVAHTAAYGRLLTTICEPSVSAVTRHKKQARHGLNDETKKARNIAGQHLQYLIMDYCDNQLKGRLRPDMKAALTPGLHAVLDVMSPDVMRTINAAMDSSSRSLFKALYEDYRRSGRGRGRERGLGRD